MKQECTKEIIGLIAGHSGDSLCDQLHERGYRVAMVCGKESDPGRTEADECLVADLKMAPQVLEFFKSLGVWKVVIGTGHNLAFQLAERLEQEGLITNLDLEKSKLAKNKVEFKEELKRISVATPEYFVIKDESEIAPLLEKCKLPCVIKSIVDTVQPAKANTRQAAEEMLRRVLATNVPAMVEEYIDGNDCTVAVAGSGKTVWDFGITYYSKAKEYKLEGFENSRAEKLPLETEEEIRGIARTIVEKLGFTGVVRIDFIVDDAKVYVLELNTVLVTGYHGSAYPFFRAMRVDIAAEFMDVAIQLLNSKETMR